MHPVQETSILIPSARGRVGPAEMLPSRKAVMIGRVVELLFSSTAFEVTDGVDPYFGAI